MGSDESGDRLEQFAREIGGSIAAREVVSDELGLIQGRLSNFSDVDRCALVLTTGGTGVSLIGALVIFGCYLAMRRLGRIPDPGAVAR